MTPKFSLLHLLALFIVLYNPDIKAQFYLAADVEGYFDDNIFNNYQNASDFINAFTGEIGYDFETDQNHLEIYYTGFLNRYYEFSDKSSTIQKLGAVNTYLFSELDNPLNVGINYIVRINKADYYIYDFNQYSLYANYMHSISESDKIQAGIIGNIINYENFSLFSHYQLKAFLRSVTSFESRTSLTAAAEIDQKMYVEQKENEGLSDEVLQTKLHLQLGQGITDNLGLSVYGFVRKNISGGNRYFNTSNYIYYEEELFNDIYSNEGIETGLNLTYLFLPDITGRAAGKYEIRNYTDLPAADEKGKDLNELRQDDQFYAGVSLEFDLAEVLEGLYLSLNYNYTRNLSNDYYYDYTNQVYAITVGFNL